MRTRTVPRPMPELAPVTTTQRWPSFICLRKPEVKKYYGVQEEIGVFIWLVLTTGITVLALAPYGMSTAVDRFPFDKASRNSKTSWQS